ncbi:D-erythronate dehydrogenase [Nitratireductor kimnyeongensis]|uniref:D-erythronate dehydrogenase n=1 Tax=Nitratireductor kimnyeongensis TaxID=430679 RepID=A0ABW0TEJ6_9HYPH|nr:D-erythronate dehydrogenase [Nitratireductor kimnyeongensis]QZZ37686.1 SDR family oxidoreductase [Nitratireductor kimnyeongensis]
MRILIIGAAGMVGRRLADRLLTDGKLGSEAIKTIHAFDVVEASLTPANGIQIETEAGDVADEKTVERLIAQKPDIIFHLAAIVSGEAELAFEKGYRINMNGSRHLLEAIRLVGENRNDAYRPRLVFTSSIAVFGAPFPEKIDDEFFRAPLTSYGTQKAIGELLLADYTRKGFVDGIGIRLPTIVVRPGKPNKAASGFFSGIIREPLAGQDAVLPVSDDVRHWVASPNAAVGFLLHAGTMDLAQLGARRSLTMPGLSVTIAEMIEALRSVAGDQVVAHIKREHDPQIAAIVDGWPRDFRTERAEQAGFTADSDFEAIIRAHIADEEKRKTLR